MARSGRCRWRPSKEVKPVNCAAFCRLLALGIGVLLAVQVAASDLAGSSWRLVSIVSMGDTAGLPHDPAMPRVCRQVCSLGHYG
jgi:hypothetical protein